MPRIRTIKPEFTESESVGRVSREARLFFVLLWTRADDEGYGRGSSRLLASLLYPYDEDAERLMEGWWEELEREHCIERFQAGDDSYYRVINWLKHQKIDHPSPSKIKPLLESSRVVREPSRGVALDQGSGIKEQGAGTSRGAAPVDKTDWTPTPEQWPAYFVSLGFSASSTGTAKMTAAYREWSKAGLKLWVIEDAMRIGDAKLGKRPSSPAYYLPIVDEVRARPGGAQSAAKPAKEPVLAVVSANVDGREVEVATTTVPADATADGVARWVERELRWKLDKLKVKTFSVKLGDKASPFKLGEIAPRP